MTFSRREFVYTSAGLLLVPSWLNAAALPTGNPLAGLKVAWTNQLKWNNVINISTIKGQGKYFDKRLKQAQAMLSKKGGGVVFFPAGQYHFADHIQLKDGIILRGADPITVTKAHDKAYRPPTRFEFPKYNAVQKGEGTPIDTAFKGIYLEEPAKASNCGIVNIDINRGHIHFSESEKHQCGSNRIVFGCVLRNAAVADPGIPNLKYNQQRWQRFTARHHAAIDVKGAENVLIANNRLPESGDDNFTMKGFLLKPRKDIDRYNVVFDYDNRPGLYINHYCIGGPGGSGNDGTPKSHPWGFRKGVIIRDNYIYNTGRMGIGFAGDGTICANNVIRFKKDAWRPTTTGYNITTGSSTNDNRAIEMRGWRWVVEDNDYLVYRNYCADKSYYINDGEGLMHEDHCNSDIRDSKLANNKGNSYLSIYKCGLIDGLLIEGNDISTPGKISDIYVVANRNSGSQPCRNVSIIGNTTRSNGILIAGSPASGNVIKNNRHFGKGTIRNEAKAKLFGNQGYDS